jgi:hypothetical protein
VLDLDQRAGAERQLMQKIRSSEDQKENRTILSLAFGLLIF